MYSIKCSNNVIALALASKLKLNIDIIALAQSPISLEGHLL